MGVAITDTHFPNKESMLFIETRSALVRCWAGTSFTVGRTGETFLIRFIKVWEIWTHTAIILQMKGLLTFCAFRQAATDLAKRSFATLALFGSWVQKLIRWCITSRTFCEAAATSTSVNVACFALICFNIEYWCSWASCILCAVKVREKSGWIAFEATLFKASYDTVRWRIGSVVEAVDAIWKDIFAWQTFGVILSFIVARLALARFISSENAMV